LSRSQRSRWLSFCSIPLDMASNIAFSTLSLVDLYNAWSWCSLSYIFSANQTPVFSSHTKSHVKRNCVRQDFLQPQSIEHSQETQNALNPSKSQTPTSLVIKLISKYACSPHTTLNKLRLTASGHRRHNMAHENVWFSRPRGYGKGARAWYAYPIYQVRMGADVE
jgi:hypothetical protein